MKKSCSNCGLLKDVSEFHKNKSKKYGRESRCKICASEYSRKHYQDNREEINAKHKAYNKKHDVDVKVYQKEYRKINIEKESMRSAAHYKANKKSIRNRHKAWRKLNPEKNKGYVRTWQKKNPDKTRANNQKRRAKKAGNEGSFTFQEWQDLVRNTGNKRLACGVSGDVQKLEADHILAIAKGGSSFIENIQPLCGYCNKSKGIKTIKYI